MALIFLERNHLRQLITFSTIFLCVFLSINNPITQNSQITTSESSHQIKPSTSHSHYFSISSSENFPSIPTVSLLSRFSAYNRKLQDDDDSTAPRSLEYEYYRDSCPRAEQVVRNVVLELNRTQPDVVPSLLRLVFHDCFVEGCDASLLLDAADGLAGEKEASPNAHLKGFDAIDLIKSKLEEACPGVVSCADVLVLAAREAVVMGGGPFYPLLTGRRDSTISFPEVAEYELPSPQDDLMTTIASFAAKGFDDREMVAILGAHSIGVIHCTFISDRLKRPDTNDSSMNSQFLNIMRITCGHRNDSIPPSSSTSLTKPSFISEPPFSASDATEMDDYSGLSSRSEAEAPGPSSVETQLFDIVGPELDSSSNTPSTLYPVPSSPLPTSPSVSSPSPSSDPHFPSADESAMTMDYKGPSSGFGTLYYQMLLENKGLLSVDQQLTDSEQTLNWVRVYASDTRLYQQDFALVMMKLSNLGVLTAPLGQVRLDCRRVL